MIEPITKQELIEYHKQWVKQNGIDSLINQYAEHQLHMMAICKEYRQTIKELENDYNKRLGYSSPM